MAYEYLPYYLNRRFQPEPAPNYGTYIEEINRYLAESYEIGNEERYAQRIASRVREGHRRNRIRMRLKMLGHFWTYLPYRKEIRAFRARRMKLFSVIHGEESLPKSRP